MEKPCLLRKLKAMLSVLQRSNSTLGSGSLSRHYSRNSFTSHRSHQPISTPNIVRVLMGCSVLSLLFNLDLSLLEVLFVYSLKKGKNDIFSMAAHLPSLQLVTELPDSTKGGAKGHVLVRAAWAGLLGHPERPFSPNHSLELPGKLACRSCSAFILLYWLGGLPLSLISLFC